ncbi:hypothetical protein [Zongyangia hominis]|uniref:Uncharacterized protein n=1 Tax=Zongyangia hominis TaxID=2763677 RepID=A0A926EGL6_9FIRM|nr:hypothetical protein [Zongyangia hominis]MBC8571451.1 hypothetical protein [Zongyangia hominis]
MALLKRDFIPVSKQQNMKPLHYPDCIHLSERCGCDLLSISECKGESCSFCQSAAQQELSQREWLSILNTLGLEQQKKIAGKYYSGKMPWKSQQKKG